MLFFAKWFLVNTHVRGRSAGMGGNSAKMHLNRISLARKLAGWGFLPLCSKLAAFLAKNP